MSPAIFLDIYTNRDLCVLDKLMPRREGPLCNGENHWMPRVLIAISIRKARTSLFLLKKATVGEVKIELKQHSFVMFNCRYLFLL